MKRYNAEAALAAAVSIVLISPAWAAGEEAGDEEYDIIQYGKDCARLIAEAPPFNCLDFEIIPITVDGKEPTEYKRHMKCDKPAYLPYPEQTDGQCSPWSRVQVVRDDDVQILQYCRRMYIRPKDDPYFDSLEMIMHNVKTGSTCFFISKNFGRDPKGELGTRVPPPTEETPPEGFPSAREIWGSPQHIANEGCIYCHDSDPWMHTPWIMQTLELPADPWGFHSVDVGGPFDAWPKPMSISTRGNPCTGCHRIANLNTCLPQDIPTFGMQPPKMLQSIGMAAHGRFGAKSLEDLNEVTSTWGEIPHGWMGERLPDVASDLWQGYHGSIEALQACCKDPTGPGCLVEPIESKAAWLERQARKD
ncbi:MAG: hypothetical protein P8R42_08775 [Candidatus Binatia bacterium]|nr:hypothetical protein [Candidatus Binatia bacterium]